MHEVKARLSLLELKDAVQDRTGWSMGSNDISRGSAKTWVNKVSLICIGRN